MLGQPRRIPRHLGGREGWGACAIRNEVEGRVPPSHSSLSCDFLSSIKINSPRFRRKGLPGLLRVLMDKASGFRYPFMMLLSLACTCSFALAFAWRGSGLHEGAFLVEFYTNGHVQEVNENAYK